MEEKNIVYSDECFIPIHLSSMETEENTEYWESEIATLYLNETIYGLSEHGMRIYWTGIKLRKNNEIFIHQSCDCYPNMHMLFLTLDELKNIFENLIDDYIYKNIRVNLVK